MEAKVLLKSTDMCLKVISDGLCFCTPSHFGRFFKRYMGCMPGAYKKTQFNLLLVKKTVKPGQSD